MAGDLVVRVHVQAAALLRERPRGTADLVRALGVHESTALWICERIGATQDGAGCWHPSREAVGHG